MTRLVRLLRMVLLAGLVASGLVVAQGASSDLRGDWTGAIDPDGIDLAIALHVEQGPEGLQVRLDVPPQGAFDLPVEVQERGPDGRWVLLAPTLPAQPVFDGVLEGDLYRGTFTQGPASLPFVLQRVAADADPAETDARPQTPRPPFPYAVSDVTFAGAAGELAGTLVLPDGEGPHPVVVLVNGSGAQDRDSTIFGHPIMAIVADHLARSGIGSLRWDDRGVGGSEGDLAVAGLDGLAADVDAAVAFLADRPDVDAARIAGLGHSEGGLVVPLAATGGTPFAATVLVAAPAVDGVALLIEQNRIILAQAGASEAEIDEQVAYLEAFAELLREGDTEGARVLVRERVNAQLDALPEGQAPTGDAREAMVDAQVANGVSPTFTELFLSEPQPILRSLSVPTLAIYFGLDVQVPPEQNAEPMRGALAGAGVDGRVVTIDGVNHVMQPAETGGLEEYAANRISVDERVLELLADWLREVLAVAP